MPEDLGSESRDRHVAATVAALLHQGQVVDRISRPLLLLAFAGLLAPMAMQIPRGVFPCFATSVLAGLAAAYLGARVAFDAALFQRLATGEGSLASLDESLTGLGLLPPAKAGRPLAPRAAGAQRLLRLQAALLLLQAAALAAAGVLGR